MARSPRSDQGHEATTEPGRSGAALGSLGLLVCHEGGSAFHALPAAGTLLIGQSEDCGVVIPHASISRHHVVITAGSPPRIEDLGSRNGTRVQGRPLAPGEKVEVHPGTLIEAGDVLVVVQRASRSLVGLGGALPSGQPSRSTPPSVIVRDPIMQQLYRFASVVAESPFTALILGETGVGKELLAEAIHQQSPRVGRPFLRMNCGALAESVLESELFGHERGAFTGAVQAKPGLFEAADKGTMFLDEIGELSLAVQVKLLRALETGEAFRVGSVQPRRFDVRFLAATNRDLDERVRAGEFRADLLFRINCITLTVPPLRERPGDIEALAEHFARAAAATMGRPQAVVTPEALRLLREHAWPGNVRELRNVIDRAVLVSADGVLRPEHFAIRARPGSVTPPPSPKAPAGGPLATAVDEFEKERIATALAECRGNRTHAAKLLGIGRRTLLTKLKLYGIA